MDDQERETPVWGRSIPGELLERWPKDENGEPYYGYEIQANDTWFFALDNPPMFLDGHPNDGCCIVDPDTLTAIDYNLSPTA